jgi:hypothetical protein
MYLLLVFCNFLEPNWQGYTNLLKIWKPPPNCLCWHNDPKQVPHLGPPILEWPVNLTVMWHFMLSTLHLYIFLLVREMLKLLGTIIQNVAARVTRFPEFVHSCTYAFYIENGFWCSWQCNWSQLITNTETLMHRLPQFTVQSSLMKSSTMENTVSLFLTVVFWVMTLYSQVGSYKRNSLLPS